MITDAKGYVVVLLIGAKRIMENPDELNGKIVCNSSALDILMSGVLSRSEKGQVFTTVVANEFYCETGVSCLLGEKKAVTANKVVKAIFF